MEEYKALWTESVTDPSGFWARMARENLFWFRDFTDTCGGSFMEGDVRWFEGEAASAAPQRCTQAHATLAILLQVGS